MTSVASKGERTRARLLDIAVRRFAADGFRRTSLAAVADEAGLTPAAVYAYFAGKEALFEAAVDVDAEELIRESFDPSEADVYPAFLLRLFENLDRHLLARRVLAGQEPDVIDRLLELPALLHCRQLIAETLAEGQRTGRVRVDIDTKVIAAGLESVVLALLMATLQVTDVDAERQNGVLALLDAVLAPPRAD